VYNTSDEMVKSAKANFEHLRKDSEQFLKEKDIRKVLKRLYRAIGQQKLVLMKSSKARVKID